MIRDQEKDQLLPGIEITVLLVDEKKMLQKRTEDQNITQRRNDGKKTFKVA